MVGTFFNLTGQLGLNNSPARVNDFETSFLILFVLGLCVRQFLSKTNTKGIIASMIHAVEGLLADGVRSHEGHFTTAGYLKSWMNSNDYVAKRDGMANPIIPFMQRNGDCFKSAAHPI